MASNLERQESVDDGLRRIALEELKRARRSLEQTEDRDEAIHDARRRLKKLRALLRLARKSLGAKRYRKENRRLRDAARPLTEVRDAKVLVDALDALIERYALPPRALVSVRTTLTTRRREAERRVLESAEALPRSRALIRNARRRARRWPQDGHGWSTLGSGIERVVRNGRRALSLAENDPSVENLHELRKQVKYLRNELSLIRPIAGARMHDLADELGTVLGDDHDLAVLESLLESDRGSFGDFATIRALMSHIDRRRKELQGEAFPLARELYGRTPQRFVRPLKDAWNAWHQDK